MVWFEYQNFRADLSFLIPKKRIHSHPDGFMPCIQQPLDGDPEVNMFVSRTSLLLLLCCCCCCCCCCRHRCWRCCCQMLS